jgi:glutaredoxin
MLFMMIGLATAGVYKWVDDDGNVQFGDMPPDEKQVERVEVEGINSIKGVSVSKVPEWEYTDNSNKKVVMYSTKWCGVCKKAKKYFSENRISYVEYDVETSEKGRSGYKKLNGKGVPIILVGNKRMNGFSVEGFKSLY